MSINEKLIGDYQISLDSISNVYVVSVRKFGVKNSIFYRQYNSRGSARRSYNNWCVRIDNINRCEVSNGR